jgi:hypothetical protein
MPMTTQKRGALGLVLVLFGAGLVLRVLALRHGYQSDEIALLHSAASFWSNPENGINPPLHRLLLHAWLSDVPALRLGRGLSLVCGTGALWFSYQIGRTIGGNRVSGAMSLALAAFTGIVIEHAALTRVYSVWFLVATWHVYAALRWLAAPDERRSAVEMAVSAALLPQLHYLSIPILALEGIVLSLVSRRWTLVAKCWAPAVVATLPLLALILRAPEAAQPGVGGGEDWQRTIPQILGLGSNGSQELVFALLVLAAVRWKRLDAGQRYVSACLLGSLGVVIGVGDLRRRTWCSHSRARRSRAYLARSKGSGGSPPNSCSAWDSCYPARTKPFFDGTSRSGMASKRSRRRGASAMASDPRAC